MVNILTAKVVNGTECKNHSYSLFQGFLIIKLTFYEQFIAVKMYQPPSDTFMQLHVLQHFNIRAR